MEKMERSVIECNFNEASLMVENFGVLIVRLDSVSFSFVVVDFAFYRSTKNNRLCTTTDSLQNSCTFFVFNSDFSEKNASRELCARAMQDSRRRLSLRSFLEIRQFVSVATQLFFPQVITESLLPTRNVFFRYVS